MKLHFKAQLLLIILAFGMGCADDGPQGPTGPAGAAGPAGPTGATGATGTANVIYGAWFKPSSYTMTTIFGMKTFSYTQAVPGITQEVLNTGVVLVYAKLLGYSSAVWPVTQVGLLPITLTYSQGGIQSDTWSGHATPGNITITFVNTINGYNSISTAHEFRYVIIPGGVAAAGGRVAGLSPDDITRLSSMSYADAMAKLGIPE